MRIQKFHQKCKKSRKYTLFYVIIVKLGVWYYRIRFLSRFMISVKYLGMHLEDTYSEEAWTTVKYSQNFNNWLLSSRSKLSCYNKILIYKIMMKLVWTYGLQSCGLAKNSSIHIIRLFQNKVIRQVILAPKLDYTSRHQSDKCPRRNLKNRCEL